MEVDSLNVSMAVKANTHTTNTNTSTAASSANTQASANLATQSGGDKVVAAKNDELRINNNVVANNRNVSLKINAPKQVTKAENEKMLMSRLEKAIANANKTLGNVSRKMEYSTTEGTSIISVKIHDALTGEVLAEIPSEKSLQTLVKRLEEQAIWMDKKS